jgi:hypothetical protein
MQASYGNIAFLPARIQLKSNRCLVLRSYVRLRNPRLPLPRILPEKRFIIRDSRMNFLSPTTPGLWFHRSEARREFTPRGMRVRMLPTQIA